MEVRQPTGGGRTRLTVGMGILKGLILIIFLGCLFMWFVMPTSLYDHRFLPKLLRYTDSTFFGSQGSTILVYTSPVLLVAVLSCLYLHLAKYDSTAENSSLEKRGRGRWLAIWKAPLVMKGLGIVSFTELAFLSIFILFVFWTFFAFFRSFLERLPELRKITGDNTWEAKVEYAGLALGLAGNVCLTLLFFPVTRCSSVLNALGLTSEASIKYHIWLGHLTMFLFTSHGLAYLLTWVASHRMSEILKWDHTSVSNVAGELSLLFGLVLWVASYPSIRRKMFELFFYTHYLYILFVVFFVLHLGISFSYLMLPGFFLFLIDRCLRFLQSRNRVRAISARVLPCETLELNFSKSPGLNYTPTSMIFINVPSISRLQWHPFTVSSSSNLEPETLSAIIKTEGEWTKKLYDMLSSPSPPPHLKVAIEGPYGPPSTHFLRHDQLVMISGGSGVSPFISIIRELIFMGATLKRKTPKVLLISAFKKSSDLTMLELISPISGITSGFSNLEVDIMAYVTRETEPSIEKPKQTESIVFNPESDDAPLYPILGKHNWIWLAVIISSSFILSMILIGIIGRYYIYPIDHNTFTVYSLSSRAFVSMLVLLFSVSSVTTLAFLWNKKQNATEAMSIRADRVSMQIADREMESPFCDSLTKPSKLHYGHRPDLKRILMECEGSSVGVLVCGPKSMRHEVATICASRLTDNLHFESISFGW